MTPQDFIRKWKNHALTERAAAQEHFIDLCRLVGHPTPAEADPKGEEFILPSPSPLPSPRLRGEGEHASA